MRRSSFTPFSAGEARPAAASAASGARASTAPHVKPALCAISCPATAARRRALADIRQVPEWWFTRTAEELFVDERAIESGELRDYLEEAQETMSRVRTELERYTEEVRGLIRRGEPVDLSPPGELGRR